MPPGATCVWRAHLTVMKGKFPLLIHRIHRFAAILFFLLAILPAKGRAQDQGQSSDPSASEHPIVPEKPAYAYVPPTETMKLHNYLFDAYGPFPMTVSAFVAGYHQARHNPPEWREGFPGYSERYGSDFGANAAGVTARYLTAQALHQDTLYYRCACNGFWPRLQYAVVSTLVAHREDDGHKVFSVPALVAPYAGSFTAVEGWYPRRYNAKDAFRMGNYGLMDAAIGNIGLEFLPRLLHPGVGSWITRLHLDNRRAARENESAP
jgi:hypothetical protein